jgi:hypothetical protein
MSSTAVNSRQPRPEARLAANWTSLARHGCAGRCTSCRNGTKLTRNRCLSLSMRNVTSLLLALTCILCGCASYPTNDDHRRQLQVQLREVIAGDGISKAEADVIAQSYFLRFGPGCGVAAPVTNGGAFWVSTTSVGCAAIPTREPIRIDKHTGRVTWSSGPTIENPKTIW